MILNGLCPPQAMAMITAKLGEAKTDTPSPAQQGIPTSAHGRKATAQVQPCALA